MYTKQRQGWSKHIEFIVFVRGKGAHWSNSLPVVEKSKVLKDNWRIKKKIHPTEKSEDIIRHLINLHTFPGDVVLDPFSGSGTTAIVCRSMARNFICVENNPEHYRNSILRLEGSDIRKFIE